MSQNVLTSQNHHRGGGGGGAPQHHNHHKTSSVDNASVVKGVAQHTSNADDRLKPTAEQIRLNQLISGKTEDPEISRKIKQVLELLPNFQTDDVVFALHESDYDVEKAVDALLEGTLSEKINEWKTVKNTRKKPATEPTAEAPLTTTATTTATTVITTTNSNGNTNGNKDKRKQRPPRQQQQQQQPHKQQQQQQQQQTEANGTSYGDGESQQQQPEQTQEQLTPDNENNGKFKRNFKNQNRGERGGDFRVFTNRRRGEYSNRVQNQDNQEQHGQQQQENGDNGGNEATSNGEPQQHRQPQRFRNPRGGATVAANGNGYTANRQPRQQNHHGHNPSVNGNANANNNNSSSNSRPMTQRKPNDSLRNIGTWNNDQIKSGDDLENNEEDDWDGDLSKTQIYTSKTLATSAVVQSTAAAPVATTPDTDANESQAALAKLSLDSAQQSQASAPFTADFPIGHFDAKEATQQIKNAIGMQTVVQQQQKPPQQPQMKVLPSVKPPPPSTRIPKSAVIMPTTSSTANNFNLDVQFGIDFGIDLLAKREVAVVSGNDAAVTTAPQHVKPPPAVSVQNDLALNDKNNNLNKQQQQADAVVANKQSDQNNKTASATVPASVVVVAPMANVAPQLAHSLQPQVQEPPKQHQQQQQTLLVSPVGLQQQLEQNLENSLKHVTKQQQQQQPHVQQQQQQQQHQPQQLTQMMFNLQPQQQQSAYVAPQKQQPQQQAQKPLLQNDYQHNNMSNVTASIKDAHQSLMTSNIVKQQQQQLQQNLMQQQQQAQQGNTGQTTPNSNNKPNMPPPPPGVNLLNPNNPFLMSLPLVYYDQNFPYFDNTQLDGNIMHMYSHQLSQLQPVPQPPPPQPIPATVASANTPVNFTTSDTKFNRVDPTSTNAQLNSNSAQQQQTFNLIPNFPFILQNYYPNMLIPAAGMPNGPQGNSQFPNKPFGFNNTTGYDEAKDYNAYNAQTQAAKSNELNFVKNLDKQQQVQQQQQQNPGYHTPPPQQQLAQSAYAANQLLNQNLNLNANNLPPYAYIASMIGQVPGGGAQQILQHPNNNGANQNTQQLCMDQQQQQQQQRQQQQQQQQNVKQTNKNTFQNSSWT